MSTTFLKVVITRSGGGMGYKTIAHKVIQPGNSHPFQSIRGRDILAGVMVSSDACSAAGAISSGKNLLPRANIQ